MRSRSAGLRVLSTILASLFPSNCPVCGKLSAYSGAVPFCDGCWNKIEKHEGKGCRTCGAVTGYESTSVCQECRTIKPAFERVISFGVYDGALKKVIHYVKFHKLRRLAGRLGREMGRLDIPAADLLVPVPLSSSGLRNREFNQASIMAKEISRIKKIPFNINLLRKVRETLPQSTLSRNERRENVKGAFSAISNLGGERIILVDDVVTTAATVNECSRALRDKGASSVIVLTAARALNK